MNQVPAFDPVLLPVPKRAMLSLSPDQQMNPVLRLHRSTSYSTVYSSMTSRGSHPHSYFILHRCFPTSLLLPGFNVPLVSVQAPLECILLFVISKQQGEKQNWKAWQSQLPTNRVPCLCQKPGTVSDRKQQRVESAQNHLGGSSDMRAFRRPELTFVRLGGWDCIRLHFIKKILRNYQGVPCGCFSTFNLMSFLSSDQSTPHLLTNDGLWVLT